VKYQIHDARIDNAPALADVVIIPIVTAFQGLVPDICLTWLTREESIANWQEWFEDDDDDGSFLLVAELDSGLVIGCALGGSQADDPRFVGELFLLGVLPEYQGQGVGQSLVRAVAARLYDQGILSMRVLVISVNPYRRFYEKVGGQFVGEVPYDWNGVELSEAIYGWPDITVLLPK
jgi:ribosomal protein S18 acetylase RimI-like enzyme